MRRIMKSVASEGPDMLLAGVEYCIGKVFKDEMSFVYITAFFLIYCVRSELFFLTLCFFGRNSVTLQSKKCRRMIIKVCGLREADNIRDIAALPVGMLGLDFRPQSERFVRMISSKAGIIPDYSEQRIASCTKNEELEDSCSRSKERGARSENSLVESGEGNLAPHSSFAAPHLVGVFADDMPQNIITRIYNYELDSIQLEGDESAVMIDNLCRSVVPDIAPTISIIKTLHVSRADDMLRWKDYEGHADFLLFDIEEKDRVQTLIDAYEGTIPFLLRCGLQPGDAYIANFLHHPMLAGFDLNEGFETAPAVKDVVQLQTFIAELTTS